MKQILLLDDDIFLRDMYARKFTQEGFDVLLADSPDTALRELSANQKTCAAAVTDMIMPGMTGVEFIQAAKEACPKAQTIYVVLSNQDSQAQQEAAMAAGASGYIIKSDAIPSEVVSQVSQLLA